MAQLNGIPVFKIKFNEDLENKEGIGFLSTVDYPAIEENWVALADKKSPMQFNVSPDKQMLYGPILIPDKPIYRYDEKTQAEYYVVFTKDVIEKLVRKFQKQQKTINLNYQHQKDSQLKDAVIQEIWLTGKVDKSQTLGFELPEGSAFVAAHIGDKEFWDKEIKTGNVKGFSIEGFLDMEMKNIKKLAMQFITAKTDKGLEIKCDGESFTTGAEVYTEMDGKKEPCADGDYVLENGTTLKVTGGKITEVVEAEETADEIVQKIMRPVIEKMQATITAQENKIKELEIKLSATPGAPAKTTNTDTPTKKLTPKQALEIKLGVMRKKANEFNKN